MYNRYSNSGKLINNSIKYDEVLTRKKINSIQQLTTFSFNALKDIEKYNFKYLLHTFQSHERLYQISNLYYKSPEYGWLICYTNQISNETVLEDGMILRIYYPLNELLRLS